MTKRVEKKTKSGSGAKNQKSRTKRGLKDLQVKSAKGVRGGFWATRGKTFPKVEIT